MPTTIDLDPDAPHSPERTRALADVGASVIRTLNYATRTTDGLNDPADAYELLGTLAQLAERLPQLCEQIRDYLTEAHNRRELFEPADGPHQGSATLALMLTRDALGRAAGDALTMREALRNAQSELRAVRYAGPDVDDDPGALSWVVYQPDPSGADVLVSAGFSGSAPIAADPLEVARQQLEAHAAGRAAWVVKVYGPDDRLRAWSEWNNGTAASYAADVDGTEA